ncbi:AI-2E family transporter [Anaerotignum sp. MB30-C6]|uniref:AI-2E family transporter n=1 Tax=Anaerotignum sp. MB30-C6 TaxID=3070814 RepID=UPI0027DE20B6|nr:AI-2E family transporter [Anaerotignum sp. MB30-C6]WMI81751.1 AI-2E family transporter [Anaerotignum sp. MB30-C6]
MRLPWNKKYLVISFHVIFTVGTLVVLGMLLFKLSEAKNVIIQAARGTLAVFAPLLLAIFFSVLLEPVTNFFQRRYESRLSALQRSKIKNRKVGTAAAYFTLIIILVIGGGWAAKGVGTADIEGLAEQLAAFVQKVGDLLVLLNLKLAELGILQNVEGILSAWTESATLWIQKKVMGIAGYIPKVGSSLVDIVVGLTAAFYFLMEKERILDFCKDASFVFFGEKATRRIRRVCREVDNVVMGYLGGQLTDAAIMGVLFSAAFTIVGLPYGVVLGLISGFSNLIPYFGAIMAFVLAVLSGLLSGEPVRALYASILILILQQIDSVYIVPKVVGKKVEMHPVLVLLSLAVFGRLFGFWGLLVAVPLGALIKSFFFWLMNKKQEKIGSWKEL